MLLYILYIGTFDAVMCSGKAACAEALHKMLLDNAVGGERPKLRPPREEDRWLVSSWVNVTLPAFEDISNQTQRDPHTLKVLWSIKQTDIWIELSLQNLEVCFALIRSSPKCEKEVKPKKVEKGSPKRKRKLKRRKSQESAEERVQDANVEHP